MRINQYLDATYLKTAIQAGISEQENLQKVLQLANEAICYRYKLVMIRLKYILKLKATLTAANAKVLI
jgi:deoxyribose-phosphate aldolase